MQISVLKNRNEQYLKLFGRNLKKLIKAKNLKPTDVAAFSGIESKQVYRILNGEQSASLSTLFSIAQGLEISMKDLFGF